jgi:hypothetical protein
MATALHGHQAVTPSSGPPSARSTTRLRFDGDDSQLICYACGSILVSSGQGEDTDQGDPENPEESAPSPQHGTTPAKAERKDQKRQRASGAHPRSILRHVSPEMLKHKTARIAARIALLATIPGLGLVRARALALAYPTFSKIMAAPVDELARVKVCVRGEQARLGPECALAVRRVLA